MRDYILTQEFWNMVNLYSKGVEFDDFSLINLCKMAVDNQVQSISVPAENVDNVWEWLELSDVELCAVINNFSGEHSVEEIFRKIKTVVNKGADVVEVLLPPETFNVDVENIPPKLDENLCAITEAKGVKKVKVSMESGFIRNCSVLKGVVYLLSKYKIDMVKTASGRWMENSTIEQLNTILEEAKSSRVGVDFMVDMDKGNKFVMDDACRLANFILGMDDIKHIGFSISVAEQVFSQIARK